MKTFLQLARDLAKPGEEILASLTAAKCHLWHMASCVPGEAGELFDAVKRFVIYEKPLDRANVVEEIADVRFYLAGLMNGLDITEVEITEAINAKLSKRYAAGSYSNTAANERADKAEQFDEAGGRMVPQSEVEICGGDEVTVYSEELGLCGVVGIVSAIGEQGRFVVTHGATYSKVARSELVLSRRAADLPKQDRRTVYGHGDD